MGGFIGIWILVALFLTVVPIIILVKVLTNDDLKQFVDTSDEWIQSRTGIKERHIVTDEYTIDLAEQASIKAIEDSGINKEDIDLVIVAKKKKHDS